MKETIETISHKEYLSLLKEIGVSYLGATRQSAKMRYSYNAKVETYCLYLAPADMSGYEVCPGSIGRDCRKFCLNGSGRNKGDQLSRGKEHSLINLSRIKKTRFFFEHRDKFMKVMLYEIVKAQEHAKKHGLGFAIRLNGTSDISPLAFRLDGKNVLKMFPDIQFYDYTKLTSRFPLMETYRNYDLTYSFDGCNWNECEAFLRKGGKVAVVFENELPIAYKGFTVIDANTYDMRYLDPPSTIMGLHYHRTAENYVNGKYVRPDSPFIIKEDDVFCTYAFNVARDGIDE